MRRVLARQKLEGKAARSELSGPRKRATRFLCWSYLLAPPPLSKHLKSTSFSHRPTPTPSPRRREPYSTAELPQEGGYWGLEQGSWAAPRSFSRRDPRAATGQESSASWRPVSASSLCRGLDRRSWAGWREVVPSGQRIQKRQAERRVWVRPFTRRTPLASFADHLVLAPTTSSFSKSRRVGGTRAQRELKAAVEEKTASRTLSVRHRVSLKLQE